MKSVNTKYIPQLDHIRFYAAMLVMIFHIAHINLIESLHFEVGVDLFFTLSGFIFFLISEESKQEIIYKKFIYNRFLRIYPLVIVLFFLTQVIMRDHFTAIDYLNMFSLNMPGNGKISWIAGDWGYNYLSFNWWTIGVEFVFYLLFPFLFKFYKEEGIYFLIKAIGVIILLRYGLYYIRITEDGWKNLTIEFNYSVFGHLDTFLMGMIAAWFHLKQEKFQLVKKILSKKVFFLSLLVSTQILLIFSDWIDSLLYPSIIGFVAGLLIVSYITSFKSTNNKTSKLLSYLGSISFSLYLLHSFVKDSVDGSGASYYILSMLNSWLSPNEASIIMALIFYIPLVILLASLTYNVIEKPFLKMRVRYLMNKNENKNIVDMTSNNSMMQLYDPSVAP